MSQPATETAGPPARRAGGGGFLTRAPLLGVPNWVWLLGFTVVGGTVFILYRNHEKAAAAAQTAATSATATTTTCQDANGNTVDCNSLYAVNSEGQGEYEQLTSQLQGISGSQAALASSIGQLQGQSSSSSSGSTGGTTTTTASGPPNVIGMELSQATQTLQQAGYSVGSVSITGISGVRNNQTVNPSGYQNYPVLAQSASGNTVSLILSG